ncbi:hypothetical protein LZ554_000608 [Drepanopeziza brunnea f. sp. 'monogermtubi']|nr:hypothetical protein LZ554_000608 [Drepanopeziza brunnea f. sp. 'monogermtubi']
MGLALKFPRMHVFASNLVDGNPKKFKEMEEAFGSPVLAGELKLAIGFILSKKRAACELSKLLRASGLTTEAVPVEEFLPTVRDTKEALPGTGAEKHSPPSEADSPKKRRKLNDSSTAEKEVISFLSDSETATASSSGSEDDRQLGRKKQAGKSENAPADLSASLCGRTVGVYRVQWYDECLKANKILPMEPYLIYAGKIIPRKPEASDSSNALGNIVPTKYSEAPDPKSIWDRAKNDTPPPASQRSFNGHHDGHSRGQKPGLIRKETSDDEEEKQMPELPEYLKNPYSCFRPTPMHGPNDEFVEQLRKIKKIREIEGDRVGFRSYNAAIASIAAYPFKIKCLAEVTRLHACGQKFAQLWYVWHRTGKVAEIEDKKGDDRFKIIEIFYGIHDVGAHTALSFYAKGWRDLDDIVENWDKIQRNQQIGVKYYDEFNKMKIPRSEVKNIGDVTLDHANRLRPGFQMVICGGYRRGKPMSGDVDIMLSHPDEETTDGAIHELLNSLEQDEYLTHRLDVSDRNSRRGQEPSQNGGSGAASSRFDSLDKGLIVWQDPDWPTKEEDLKANPHARNPNPHRRVDILVSPWKTAGCAVLGWTGGTMFERDLRLYCREKLGLRFDSSGIRRRDDGTWLDFETGGTDMVEKEKMVFAGLKIPWREPTERYTD